MALPSPAYDHPDTVAQLLANAQLRKTSGVAYAGEVTPQETWAYLSSHPGLLVDVRTPQEWRAGMPDAARTQGELVTLSWRTYPNYDINPTFIERLAAAASDKHAPLFFLCRSGGRSLDAAAAMTAVGYEYCFNVAGGFEGERGWKESQLPWKQG